MHYILCQGVQNIWESWVSSLLLVIIGESQNSEMTASKLKWNKSFFWSKDKHLSRTIVESCFSEATLIIFQGWPSFLQNLEDLQIITKLLLMGADKVERKLPVYGCYTDRGLYTHAKYNHTFHSLLSPRSILWSTIQTDEVNELCVGPINRERKEGRTVSMSPWWTYYY